MGDRSKKAIPQLTALADPRSSREQVDGTLQHRALQALAVIDRNEAIDVYSKTLREVVRIAVLRNRSRSRALMFPQNTEFVLKQVGTLGTDAKELVPDLTKIALNERLKFSSAALNALTQLGPAAKSSLSSLKRRLRIIRSGTYRDRIAAAIAPIEVSEKDDKGGQE